MHECPDCGQACACDIEDMWQDAPNDCQCCLGAYDDDYEDDDAE